MQAPSASNGQQQESLAVAVAGHNLHAGVPLSSTLDVTGLWRSSSVAPRLMEGYSPKDVPGPRHPRRHGCRTIEGIHGAFVT